MHVRLGSAGFMRSHTSIKCSKAAKGMLNASFSLVYDHRAFVVLGKPCRVMWSQRDPDKRKSPGGSKCAFCLYIYS